MSPLLPSTMPPAEDLLLAACTYAVVLIGTGGAAALLLIGVGCWRTVHIELQRDAARREVDRLRRLLDADGDPHQGAERIGAHRR